MNGKEKMNLPISLKLLRIDSQPLYEELAIRITSIIHLDMPFYKVEFSGGLRVWEVKRSVHSIEQYNISKYQRLTEL